MTEDSLKSKNFFKMHETNKRKKNVVRSRSIMPRSSKREGDFSFSTKVVLKSTRLEYDEVEVESISKRLQMELKQLT